jgi:hypothetical protein
LSYVTAGSDIRDVGLGCQLRYLGASFGTLWRARRRCGCTAVSSAEFFSFASARNFSFRLEVSIPVMFAWHELSDSLLPELETVSDPDSAFGPEYSFPPVFTVYCSDFGNTFYWLDLCDAYHFAPLGFRARFA